MAPFIAPRMNRPANPDDVRRQARALTEGYHEGNEVLVQDFAQWLADEGLLGTYLAELDLDMTIRDVVAHYTRTPLGRDRLAEWARLTAEYQLEDGIAA